MKLINSFFVLGIFTLLTISCANNESVDYTSLKQKALEIPPDFQLEPPAEGEKESIIVPVSNESQDIQTILEESTSIEKSSDEVTNKDIKLEEFVDENFLTKKESKQEDIIEQVIDEDALANEAKKAREQLLEYIAESNQAGGMDMAEEEIDLVEEISEPLIEEESDIISEDVAEEFSEEQFFEELSNTEEITSLPEEEQLQPMILDDMPVDNTDFGDEDLTDLLDRVDDLLNSYSN